MRIAGFLLLVCGWALVVAALALLPGAGARLIFLMAGVAVEVLGLVLVFRSHLAPKENHG